MDRRERLPGEFALPRISSAGPAVSQSDACPSGLLRAHKLPTTGKTRTAGLIFH
jgi:hypothetical protein